MRKWLLLIVSAVALAAIGTPASAIQCVPYAREVSGINLKGDAWQWWNAASGVYDRGRTPQNNAVLVFTRQGSMRYGHVSVVTRVISSRLVLVDHANWAPARTAGRGAVTTAVPVLDVSPKNDWTQVRVWFHPTGDFGNRVYRTDGYVYRPRDNRQDHPAVHKAALTRATEMFPGDHALARQAMQPKPAALETSKTEAAPRVNAIAAEAAAKAAASVEILAEQGGDAASAPVAPSAEGLVRVAKHVFRPNRAAAQPTGLDTLLFN